MSFPPPFTLTAAHFLFPFLLQTSYCHISCPTLPLSHMLLLHFQPYTFLFTFPVFRFLLHTCCCYISWLKLPALHMNCVRNRSLSTIKCTISGASHFVVLSEFWVNDFIPYIRSLLFTHNAFWFWVYNWCTLAQALFPTIQCGEPTSWKSLFLISALTFISYIIYIKNI